jgi:hypothetical protein
MDEEYEAQTVVMQAMVERDRVIMDEFAESQKLNPHQEIVVEEAMLMMMAIIKPLVAPLEDLMPALEARLGVWFKLLAEEAFEMFPDLPGRVDDRR